MRHHDHLLLVAAQIVAQRLEHILHVLHCAVLVHDVAQLREHKHALVALNVAHAPERGDETVNWHTRTQ